MNTFVSYKRALVAAFVSLLLSACLPEDPRQGDAARTGEEAISAWRSNFVGEALSNYALRSQYAMTSAAEWQAGTVAEGAIDMGRINMGSAGALATSAFCRDAAGRAYHLTWTKREADGGGANVAAISRRASSDMVGLAASPGIISLRNGKTITLSAACLNSGTVSIPTNAAVLAMAMSMPTDTNLAGRTNVMFETAACSRARSAGYELVKVVSRYDAAGKMEIGYPQRSVVSSSCTEQKPADAQVTASTSQILSNAGGFGTSGIARLIDGALGQGVPCAVTQQIEVTGYDENGQAQKKAIEGMDSCKNGAVDTTMLGSYSDTDLDGDYWETNDETGSCQSGAGTGNLRLFNTPGIWSWPDWDGVYTSHRWVDRTYTSTSDGKEATVNVTRGPWIGKNIYCSRQERFRADCADISAVQALGKPYASNDMWVNVDILTDTNRHFDADWVDDLFGNAIGCWFGCDNLVALDVDIMNKDYFDGLEVSGELHMKRAAKITQWDNANTFAPHVPREAEKDPWAFNSALSTCAVSVRTPLFTCKGSSEIRATSSPRSLTAANVIRHDLLAKLYSYPRTSDGAVLTTLDPVVDKKYLIIGGKYPSDYSIKKLHWAIKSCGIKGCDTDHQERMVYRVYIDNDKNGYQKVLDQGFYYANKKVMYDPTNGFYMTDKSIKASANDITRCEVVRLEGRSVHNFKYNVMNVTEDGVGLWNEVQKTAEFIPLKRSNYVAKTPSTGYSTKQVANNVCVGFDGIAKYCSVDPYAGKTSLTCEEMGMHTIPACISYNSSGDDTVCTQWISYCSASIAPAAMPEGGD